MMIDHGVCEGLCALAASGHLAEADREALALHCLRCRLCRNHLSELAVVGTQLLVHAEPSFRMPAGSLERFRARAAREGIAMRQPRAGAWMSYALCSALVTAMLFVVARSVFPRPMPEASAHGVMPTVVAVKECASREAVVSPALVRVMPKRRSRTLPARVSPVQRASFAMAFASRYALMTQGKTRMSMFDASPYPALSGMEMERLDLFRGGRAPKPREPLGMAALECPSALSVLGCSFDFASNIRQLRFQIPNVP